MASADISEFFSRRRRAISRFVYMRQKESSRPADDSLFQLSRSTAAVLFPSRSISIYTILSVNFSLHTNNQVKMFHQLLILLVTVVCLECKPIIVRNISGKVSETMDLVGPRTFLRIDVRLQHYGRWDSPLSRQTFIHALPTRMSALEWSANDVRRYHQWTELLHRCIDQSREELLSQSEHECQWPVVFRSRRRDDLHGRMRRLSKSR